MAFTSAITNQVARGLTGKVTSSIKSKLGLNGGSPTGSGGGFSGINGTTISKNLTYPLNVEGDPMQGHYIMFLINTTDQAKVKKSEPFDETLGQDVNDPSLFQEDSDAIKATQAGAKPRFKEGGVHNVAVTRPSTVRLERAISLYMPATLQTQYSADYADAEIGAGAQAGGAALDSILTNTNNFTKIPSLQGFKNMGADTGIALTEFGASYALGFADKALNTVGPLFGLQGTISAAQIRSGHVMTNKMELLFKKINRRTFSYSFDFFPKSETEVRMVHDIIMSFKRHMMPEGIDHLDIMNTRFNSRLGRFLKVPDSFDIQYMYKGTENPWIGKVSTCYCTGVDVKYGGDRYTAFEPTTDVNHTGKTAPPPQKTSLTVTFNEIESLTRSRIDDGL